MPDWIERSDDALRSQATQFSKGISADPGAFGATPLQALELAEKLAAFESAYLLTRKSFTDCTTATLVKNETRAALVACMRARARTIRTLTDVSSSQKVNLHMPVPCPRRTRVPAPADTPDLTLGPPDRRRIPARVRSTLTPETRGLPRDVTGVQVFAAAGSDMPPMSDTRWRPLGTFSRSNFDVEYNFRDARSGEMLWVVARYTSARAKAGPWSRPVYTYVVGPAMVMPDNVGFAERAA